jgi:hypothetical protein
MCANWHGLAKLRMHTDQTLGSLDKSTALLGLKFRHFVNNTCRRFDTRELQCEAEARVRRAAKKSTTSMAPLLKPTELATQEKDSADPTSTVTQEMAPECYSSTTTTPLFRVMQQINTGPKVNVPASSSQTTGYANGNMSAKRKSKTFNFDTYKYHSLGDYVEHIRQYGTMDSYSTEPVRRLQLSIYLLICLLQGELEHRTPKARYKRTNRKEFVTQLA